MSSTQTIVLRWVIGFAVVMIFLLVLAASPLVRQVLLGLILFHVVVGLVIAFVWWFRRRAASIKRTNTPATARDTQRLDAVDTGESNENIPTSHSKAATVGSDRQNPSATAGQTSVTRTLSQQEVEQQRRLCRELLKVDWRELRGGAFVKFLCRVFEAHHAVAVVASNIRDQGVDLVVTLNQVRYTVVIKDLPGTTGNSSVMQAIAGMPIYQCQSSMVISQGTFSPAAIQLAAEQQTTLIDRHQIRSLIDGTHHFYAANTSH